MVNILLFFYEEESGYFSLYSDGLAGLGSIFVSTIYFLSSPQRPDRLWGPPSLLFNEYRGLFLLG
jgi:hypothetical protein